MRGNAVIAFNFLHGYIGIMECLDKKNMFHNSACYMYLCTLNGRFYFYYFIEGHNMTLQISYQLLNFEFAY